MACKLSVHAMSPLETGFDVSHAIYFPSLPDLHPAQLAVSCASPAMHPPHHAIGLADPVKNYLEGPILTHASMGYAVLPVISGPVCFQRKSVQFCISELAKSA